MANKIDIKTVNEIAHLCKAGVRRIVEAEMLRTWTVCFDFIEKLNEIDTSSVKSLDFTFLPKKMSWGPMYLK